MMQPQDALRSLTGDDGEAIKPPELAPGFPDRSTSGRARFRARRGRVSSSRSCAARIARSEDRAPVRRRPRSRWRDTRTTFRPDRARRSDRRTDRNRKEAWYRHPQVTDAAYDEPPASVGDL